MKTQKIIFFVMIIASLTACTSNKTREPLNLKVEMLELRNQALENYSNCQKIKFQLTKKQYADCFRVGDAETNNVVENTESDYRRIELGYDCYKDTTGNCEKALLEQLKSEFPSEY